MKIHMKKETPQEFTTLHTEIGYRGRAFTVRKDTLKLPDGRETVYDIIDHPGAVTIIPVDKAGNIYFVRQFRPATGEVLLELPAGTLEKGEDPLECAQREIQEETGFAATKFTSLGAVWLAPGYSTEYLHFFLATDLYPSRKEGDEDEFISVDVIPYLKALEMAKSGLIKDGKSLAGLFLIGDKMQENNLNRLS
jgi:ADP-ribose pyrophosphatase